MLAILEASDPIKSGTERRLYIERPPPCVYAPEGQALNDWKKKGPIMAIKLNDLAAKGKQIYTIASRCGVFAKTDIQALMNDGAVTSRLVGP